MRSHLSKCHKLIKQPVFNPICFFTGLCLLLFAAANVSANNIQVVNGALVGQNTVDGYHMVQFDLSWENSWRTDNLFPDEGPDVGNRDAAWVFVKYRENGGVWQHARLHDSGHSTGSGTPATLVIGLPDESSPFHLTDNPGVGAFIYRSENGIGSFSANEVQLRWNYGVDDIPDTAPLEIKVFAIEMVLVPDGPFSLGSGGNEAGHFHQADHPTLPYRIINEGAITTASFGLETLWGQGGTGGNDAVAPSDPSVIPAAFPKGFDAFYMMKYSISQQQYVDFLNTLTYAQQDARIDGSPDDAAGTWVHNAHRHAIKITTPGIDPHTPAVYETEHPYVASNYISWMDGSAYLDWAGLRPYTELEYEKAARGPVSPVPNEYAWGTTTIANTAYTLSDEGNADEAISTNYSSDGNALYGITAGAIGGPVRVGIFSTAISNRVQSGASYWGIMELSGNLSERTVTVGNEAGRDFSALHGNGQLTTDGHGSVANWPGMGIDGIMGAEGSGFRGGAWNFSEAGLLVSGRTFAAGTGTLRPINGGFRGARSTWNRDPQTAIVDVTNPETGRIWMDRNLGASRAATSSTDPEANGDLYQWGRAADGHQKRHSPTTTTLSSSDQPGHGSFIIVSNSPWDWRNPQNDNLWQGVNGINNPCPAGYRLPTDAEWNDEIESWVSEDAAGAFGSPLKLPMAGYRDRFGGLLFSVGSIGYYWTSTVFASNAMRLAFGSGSAHVTSFNRAGGYSVRCIKD